MSLETLSETFPWARYSKKLAAKILRPRCVGVFTEDRGMRKIRAREGNPADGNCVQLDWLVDPNDGVIVDAKFQVFGQSALIGAAEVACELLIGKNYDQAKRIGVDLIDKQVRDRSSQEAFPKETYGHLNLVLEAIEAAAEQCIGIPVAESYVAPPAPMEIGEVLEGGYPGWETLSIKQQIQLMENLFDEEIRPYIALDGGGVEIINLLQGKEVVIAYQGNCTSCFASVGSTLSYIQQVLRAKIHPDIVVTL